MAKKRNELYYQLPRGIGLEELTDEEAGIIWKALDRYQGEREYMQTSAMRLIYKSCCDHIDSENERYEVFLDKQRERSRKQRAWIEKHSTEVGESPRSSTEVHGAPSNHNHNTESETQSESESESESKTESQSNQNHPPTEEVKEEEGVKVDFVSECLNDTQWMEVIAMKTHTSLASIPASVQGAHETMIADGDYPKTLNEFKARAHRIITNSNNKTNGNKQGIDPRSILERIADEYEQGIRS